MRLRREARTNLSAFSIPFEDPTMSNPKTTTLLKNDPNGQGIVPVARCYPAAPDPHHPGAARTSQKRAETSLPAPRRMMPFPKDMARDLQRVSLQGHPFGSPAKTLLSGGPHGESSIKSICLTFRSCPPEGGRSQGFHNDKKLLRKLRKIETLRALHFPSFIRQRAPS